MYPQRKAVFHLTHKYGAGGHGQPDDQKGLVVYIG